MPSNGQPVNEYIQELLSVGPFGGLDTTTEPYFLAETNFVDGSNFIPNVGYAGFVTVEGRQAFLNSPLPGMCTGMSRVGIPSSPNLYIFAVTVAGVGYIYTASQGGTPTLVPTPVPLTPNLQTSFADSQHWIFITNGVDTPLKYDVLTSTITNWGIDPPATAPLLIIAGVCLMYGKYYYCITYGTANQESSQGVVSQPITVTNQGIALTSIPVSSDSQVTERNIYRLGGALGQWRLIHTIPDNVTTTYADTLADANVTGQLLTVNRDAPLPFISIVAHKERIWGFGTPSDPSIVYYSNLNEPWGFNNLKGNYPVGENSFNDVAVGMASIGTQLILMKSRSTYNVTGSTNADFQVNKLFDIGCRSQRSICQAYGVCWWVSKQGIYQFDGNSPTNLSDGNYQVSNIKSVISSLNDSDFANCTSFVYERMVHFSFPTLNKTYLFDLRSQGWYPMGWALDQVAFDLESNYPVIGTNLNSSGQIDHWFASPGDFGGTIDSYIVSRITDSGSLQTTKACRYIELQAPVQVGTVIITTVIDPGTLQFSDTSTFDLADGNIRQQGSLPPTLIGAEVQLKILVRSASVIHIQKVSVHGYAKAMYRNTD